MKNIILKIVKPLLGILLLLIICVLVFGIVLVAGWPWWVGFFVLLGLAGLLMGCFFLRKLWLRRREQRFVQKVIDQDEASLKPLGDEEKERLRDLQGRWKEAIAALRASHLGNYGNPLYVLPWYLVIGESGSGKTTAIMSAKLSSPFADVSKTSGISGTRNCDWWFFEQGIVIDTAGRYAIPVDPGRDKEEWESFLRHLVKYRKREPINGLVVTVSAEKLIEAKPEVIEEDGRSIRKRIDELMRVLGAKFPSYVLVTKCDLIKGMTQFCDRLPEQALEQAMGIMNHNLSQSEPLAPFLRRALDRVVDRLRFIRLLLFQKPGRKGIEPELLLFPEEFDRLGPGIRTFVEAAFKETKFQETPILRGIYFSSGRQEGSPYSHFLKALGLIMEREVLPGTSKGLFLHDFFSIILPKDRSLFAPTQRRIEWGRLTTNLGLTSWVLVILALCGLLAFSFVKNSKALSDLDRWFSPRPILQGELLSDIRTMERFRVGVGELAEKNRSWWFPRLGLNETENVEAALKAKYCEQFKKWLLVPMDKRLTENIMAISDRTPPSVIAQYVNLIVGRVRLLQARLQDKDIEVLKDSSRSSYDALALIVEQKLFPEIRENYALLYLHFLVWQKDKESLTQEMKSLQSSLRHLVASNASDLKWLVDWVNENPSLSRLTFASFWGGSLDSAGEKSVPPAFTLHGKEQIEGLLKDIESALPDPLLIAGQTREFREWYKRSYLSVWYGFASSFPKGTERLKGEAEWKQIGAKMATEQGPYFALLGRMASELQPFALEEASADWLKVVYDFHFATLQAQLGRLKGPDKAGTIDKAADTAMKIIAAIEKKLGKKETKDPGALSVAAKSLERYQGALAQIVPITASRKIAYEMAAALFVEERFSSKSPFFEAQTALDTLRSAMSWKETSRECEDVWRLVTGPLDFFCLYACNESACFLEERWEKDVLVEIEGVSKRKDLVQRLFGGQGWEGCARKFVTAPAGPAAPFLERSSKEGFLAKKVMGYQIPFDDRFLSFLTKGFDPKPQVTDFPITIEANPTSANPGAKKSPTLTSLEIQCEPESIRLDNYNQGVTKTFKWSSTNCGEVLFEIKVGDLVLSRKYGDFAKFLEDFRDGKRTFLAEDFPGEAEALRHLGIRWIKVDYRFKGHERILELLKLPRVPEKIGKCWAQ